MEILQNKRVEVGGVQLAYREAGSGPPVVFASGWSLEHSYWNVQVDALADNSHVYAYDRRQQGNSEGGTDPFDFDTLVTELGGFLDAVLPAGELPVLVGHSLAGSLVLQFAAEQPQRLRGLVVADAPPVTLGDRIAGELEVVGFRFATSELGLGATTLANKLLFWSEEFREANPVLMALWTAQYQTNPVPYLLNSLSAWVDRRDMRRALGRITVPTLLLVGSEDAIVSVEDMQTFENAIPDSTLRVVEGSGHMIMIEKPDEVTALLRDFLAAL